MKQLLIIFGISIIQFITVKSDAQYVFSEKSLDYKKSILPYDLPSMIPLDDRNFILFQEEKKDVMKLGRYDQYFFEKWEKSITFDQKESVPQMLVSGDSLLIFRFTALKDQKLIKVSFDIHDTSGKETGQINCEIPFSLSEQFVPKIAFSPDRSKFMIYNFQHTGGAASEVQFHIFKTGETEAYSKLSLPAGSFPPGIESRVHLDDDGDLLLTTVSATDYKITTYYRDSASSENVVVESNFFLERPPQRIGQIEIIRQGASSYFIAFAAHIEDELIGYCVLGVNVVLKTVLFSHNQNLRQAEINELYEDYALTGERQKKKRLKIPEKLDNFRLIRSFVTNERNIMLAFEELALPVWYHQSYFNRNLPWKVRSDEDKYSFGGDLFFYCFNQNGEIIWKKTIQKTQYSKGSSHGLSMIPRVKSDRLDMLMYEYSKGGNMYLLSLNTSDGSISEKINLLPDRKLEFLKKYAGWLDDRAVLIGGHKPSGQNKRSLLLVEY